MTAMIRLLIVTLFASCFLVAPIRAQDTNDQLLRFEAKHRVNAHGNEFNGLARSSDGKRLFVATEKGDVIIWNIASQKPERTLRQTGAVHLIVALPAANEVLTAASSHQQPANSLVRRWNVDTGSFVDLIGFDKDAFLMALAVETKAGLVAAATNDGTVVTWDLATNKQLASWKLSETPVTLALIGREVYVVAIDPKALLADEETENAILKLKVDDPKQAPAEFLRVAKRAWTELKASPDYRLLSATYQSGREERVVILDASTRAELGKFDATEAVWADASKLVLFSWLDPSEVVLIPRRGPATSTPLPRMRSDTDGRAFDLSGLAANAFGSKVWASYQKGPGLLEFDLTTNKITTLVQGPSGAYTLSVSDPSDETGKILTGGADGYVRLWKFADLSLEKEFHVAPVGYFVTYVHVAADRRRGVVGITRIRKRSEPPNDPVQVWLLDLQSGQQKKLFDMQSWPARLAVVGDQMIYPQADTVKLVPLDNSRDTRELKVAGFVGTTAVSANGRWLAVLDDKKNLTVFDLQTQQKKTVAAQTEDFGAFVVTNDGRYVYQIANEGELTRWDMNTGEVNQTVLARIREQHSNVDFMTLANDDAWLVTAGNHGDVGIFERETGRLVAYPRTSSAAFYVETVWLQRNRMIFTTDTGVMIEGNLVGAKN